MTESNTCKLIEILENLITDEQRQIVQKELEKVAAESLDGLQELKNLRAAMKERIDEMFQQMESHLDEMQADMDCVRERRRQQVDDVYSRLGTLLERLHQADVSGPTMNELERKTQDVMKTLKETTKGLTQEMIKKIKELNAEYSKISENINQEIKAAIEEISQIISCSA